MAFHVSQKGLDGERKLNVDDLGKLYISVVIIWTAIVFCASSFLLYNRDLPVLRVRKTHLWTAAVTFLHSYWVLCLLAYVFNGTYPCTAEFWIMSLWLPFGMALFQVNGMHLLHIASLQTRFIRPQSLYAYHGSRSVSSGWRSLRKLGLPDSLSRRQKVSILAGVVLQVLATMIVYLVSRKFHPSFGVVGHAVDAAQCRRGWECLLGSPMWLLALYSPSYSSGFAKASRYFIPPLWFTPGIVAMEVSVIFIPCVMVVKSRKLQSETLQQILEWDRNKGSGTSVDTGSTYVSGSDEYRVPSPAPSTAPIRNELYSMKALEKALTTNITPLLRFSALKDFSAENISFLKHIQDWKATWTATSSPPPASVAQRFPFSNKKPSPLPLSFSAESLRRHQFALAVEIYISFISREYSDFPINISGPQYCDLECIFSDAASTLDTQTQENSATPFDAFPCPDLESPSSPRLGDDMEKHADGSVAMSSARSRERDELSIASTSVNTISNKTTPRSTYPDSDNASDSPRLSAYPALNLLSLTPRLAPDVAIPPGFGPQVFNEAERAVKYVVLTNTWPKFVAAGSASKGSEERGGRLAGVVSDAGLGVRVGLRFEGRGRERAGVGCGVGNKRVFWF
ncbi:hypothetical protein EPUS_07575 [Endocarpon pusillum Z07020]|uniref:RGS domain-containing protein n=1 Tax=Endocarpon pusillum (strain Z07020 / HMAS-L-300199) TaxID=1263415 RepID=U1HL93_ENDPU|nr:uncharacterized protein EPUS_07575 [Endocarpon pusillum Z07020]ERF69749.1 hypothetical protein EPUS_07575 [Endocarpon pusillum Z07020]